MSATINKIAQLSGVSRGTVDRVLHGRGKVNPKTEKRVLICAQELGYTPNRAGVALAVKKKKHNIAVIICTDRNPFFEDVLKGINSMAEEYKHYGMTVQLHLLHNIDPQEQLAVIESVREDISGLIITPVDNIAIKGALNSLDIPIINLNTDIEGTNRISYVGTDYQKGGRLAAGMVKLLKPEGATVGVINGSKKLYSHSLRGQGFSQELEGGSYKIISAGFCEDDDLMAYEVTTKLLEENSAIDVIFIAAGGVSGSCRAVMEHEQSEISIICFDSVPTTVELMKQGLIKATICQSPSKQGENAMQIMLEFLVTGKTPETGDCILEHEIRIKQNY